jgi:hypothetical protein
MKENSRAVITVVRIATDVGAAINQQNLFVALGGNLLGNDTAGETGSDDKPIKHGLPPRLA